MSKHQGGHAWKNKQKKSKLGEIPASVDTPMTREEIQNLTKKYLNWRIEQKLKYA